MENLIINYDIFESIKHIDEFGNEYWEARELIKVLGYNKWQNFDKIIYKSKIACENSNISTLEHFTDISKTIIMPKNASKKVNDYKLSRYACYLIAQKWRFKKENNCSSANLFCCTN